MPVDSGLTLRPTCQGDVEVFFQQQLDPESRRMAAFTVPDPTDRSTFHGRWVRILSDDSIHKWTVLEDGAVAGHVLSFVRDGHREVGYWLGRRFWGRGIATGALSEAIGELDQRPLYARAASDNKASRRVLEKSGFEVTGHGVAHANARGEETEETFYTLR